MLFQLYYITKGNFGLTDFTLYDIIHNSTE
jgi:hypothetical protein